MIVYPNNSIKKFIFFMKKICFLLLINLISPLVQLEEELILDPYYSFKISLDGPDRLSIEKAMSEAMRGILLKVSGYSKTLEMPVVRRLISSPEDFVNEYQIISGQVDNSLMINFSFNKKKLKDFISNNGLPIWTAKSSKVLFYFPCLYSNQLDLDYQENYKRCLKHHEDLELLATSRSLIMISPTLDLLDTTQLNSLDTRDLTYTLNKISRRYGLEDWLVCFEVDEYGRPLEEIICQSNFNKLRSSSSKAITSLADNVSKKSRLSIDRNNESTVMVLMENVDSYLEYVEIRNLLDSLLLISSHNLSEIRGSNLYFNLQINGNSSDLRKIFDSDPYFLVSGDQENKNLSEELIILEYQFIN